MLTIIPKHIAIIPDGNRRWAKETGMFPIDGHKRGCEVAHEIAKACISRHIEVLTLWGFSTENWGRSTAEVNAVMALMAAFIKEHIGELVGLGARLRHLGNRDKLPKTLLAILDDGIQQSCANTALHLNLAINYGGSDELLRAIRTIKDPTCVTEGDLMALLDTGNLPPVDLVIRTGGQQRLSGLMPLQSQYAELYFTPVYWPAFSTHSLDIALEWYTTQKRNFGK